jgi:S1-C subfamily serine protease
MTVQGLDLQTLDQSTARTLGLPTTLHGAVVLKVAPNSPLAQVLQPLDVIYSINGHGVSTADDAMRALSVPAAQKGQTIGFDRVVKGAVERREARLP